MRMDSGGGSNSSGVGLVLWLLPFALSAEAAFAGQVHGPGHVVHAPVIGTFVMHHLLLLAVLGRDLLPGLVLLLLHTVRHVLSVPCLLTLLTLAITVILSTSSSEPRRKLELPLQAIDGGGHCNDFVIIRRSGSQSAFRMKVIELGLGHSHKGLVGQGRKIPVKVLVLVHPVDVALEVVAWDNLIGQEEDPKWFVDGCTASNNL
jgi:hypothetical protein